MRTLTQAGDLGASYAAFNPAGGGEINSDMRLQVAPERLADRKGLLSSLDGLRRDVDASGLLESADKYQQQAFDTISAPMRLTGRRKIPRPSRATTRGRC